ncbi:MAG: VOC family protein [Chloroflexi bacterium]|nr:MAG: VOC family protein [Chloroflexota bacterium]
MTSNTLGNNKVMQIGMIVENIEDTVQAWSRLLGVEPPSITLTDSFDISNAQYQGKPTTAQAKLAFFDLGQVSLELIEPVGESSTWNDQLTAHGPGLHHIAFEIKGMQEHIRGLADHGLQLIQQGEYQGGRYAYMDGQKRFGTVIELLEND